MIQIGRSFRWFNDYKSEVEFSIRNGFDFMQIWFKNGEILADNIPEPKNKYIKEIGFPVIFHAVFDPVDFSVYGDQLIDLVNYFGHKEVIVHPVCEKSLVNANTEKDLAAQVRILRVFQKER